MIFKSKYDENLSLVSVSLENPEEYKTSDGKYLLSIKNFTTIERFCDNLVTTQGVLRILFNEELKIEIFEFLSKSHQENPLKDLRCCLVNDFGITPQYSRTLIIAEALTEMDSSIIDFVSKFDN